MPAKVGIQIRSAFEIRLRRMTDQGKSLGVQEKGYSTLDLKSTPIAKPGPAWTEAYRGVQQDESHFRKYAKQFFGLEKSEELAPAWQRTKVFLLSADFKWPDAATLNAEKSWLQQGVELGMFSKESAGFIDVMFTP